MTPPEQFGPTDPTRPPDRQRGSDRPDLAWSPVRVRGTLDAPPSRALWLVKWLLLIPHYLLLWPLWLAFLVLTPVAFVAVLVTGRYPRSVLGLSVGVLRWSWRVSYYGYSALGTDRYPPFSLAPDDSYPADLEVDEPERLSRGLVLVKWWLLAIPHYLVLGLLVGPVVSWTTDEGSRLPWGGGLIGLLVLVAAVVLLFRGRYPQGLHALVVGLNRWVLRVVAYATLMTDRYPPFRLDQGPQEPLVPVPTDGRRVSRAEGWSLVPAVVVAVGAVMVVLGLGTAGAGLGVLDVDGREREDGYLPVATESLFSPGHAVVLGDEEMWSGGVDGRLVEEVLGDVRIEVEPGAGADVFVGVAATQDLAGYLDGVGRSVPGRSDGFSDYQRGVAPPGPPAEQDIWQVSTSGPGRQQLDWSPEQGRWALVVMNSGGERVVVADVRLSAEVPWLVGAGWWVLVSGVVLALLGAGLVALAVRLAQLATRRRTPERAGP